MTGHSIRRAVAVLAAAALTATLASSALAAPASAAKPKCQGKTATIVGTKKADRIVGTAKRDIIVAKGGNDRIFGRGGNDLICAGPGADLVAGNGGADKLLGNAGPDRFFGGAGPDRIFAGVGNDKAYGGPGRDVVDGGPGTDTCYQNLGTGPVVRCELPAAPVAPVAPTPTPTPTPDSGPKLIDLDAAKILAVAYSDIDGVEGYSTDDVLIAKLVDEDGDMFPSIGDTIRYGRYPTKLDPGPSDFQEWTKSSRTATGINGSVREDGAAMLVNDGDAYGTVWWHRQTATQSDWFHDIDYIVGASSDFEDRLGGPDYLVTNLLSPGRPATTVPHTQEPGIGNQPFIDVDLNYTLP